MRLLLLLSFLCGCGWLYSQGSGFSFSYTGPTQIIVGPDCVAELDWGHPNTPTAMSNLPGGMIVSFEIYSISGGYQIGDDVGGGTVVTVFYQAIDNFGNSALFGFSIAFIDVIPPYFDPLSLPPNLTVNCTGNFPVMDPEVHDNCEEQDIVLTVTFTETNNAAPCTGGIITRTWVADDDLGNTASFVQTITVLPDNTPPVIANNLLNGSAPCANAMAQYSAWLTTQRANFMATDAGCGVMTLSDNAPPPSQITSFCGVITVTFTAKDNCNNTSTVQKTFTVTNSVPPVIQTPAGNASGNCSQPNISQIFNNWISTHGGATATDDCSSVVWSTSPPSPSLNDTCDADIMVMFIAGDGCGNFDTTSASFTLTDDTPPAFTTDPASMVLSCTSPVIDSLLMDWVITSGHSQAHDLCTSDPNLQRGYRIGGIEHTPEEVLAAWQDSLMAGCKDNVIINGVGINNVLSYIAVQFTYKDNCGNEAGRVGYFGITDNGRPVFDTLPSDTAFACSVNDDWQDVFIEWYNAAGGASYSDACSGVTVQASITADSAITYLMAALDTSCMQGTGITIQFSLMDDCGNVSLTSPSASFSLQDTIPPVLITPASDLMASCAMNGQLQLNNWLDTSGGANASDGCGALMWEFSWMDTSGINTGMPGMGPYPQIAGLNCAAGLEIVFTATDICQNSLSDTAVFSLIDTVPPVILIGEDSIHLACNDTIPIDTPQVSDACNGNILISFEDVAGPDSCLGQPEIIIRTWMAIDECGNSSTTSQYFFRIDTLAPVFELPVVNVEFCLVDTLPLINLMDNCDPAPTSDFMDVISGNPCEQMLTRTWTISDACGNSTTGIQAFDLSDTLPPVISYSPGHFTYNCDMGNVQDSYEQWKDSVVILDGCSDAAYFIAIPGSYMPDDSTTWPGTPLPDSVFLSCDMELIVNGDLVAYDACGNVTVQSISFSVVDITAPVIQCPAVLQVEPDTSSCSGLVHLEAPVIEEICFPDSIVLFLILDGGDTIILDSTGVLDTVMEVGLHTAMWIATDCKGNAGTCISSIEIIDENAVSLTCPPDTLLFATESGCTENLWIYPPQTTSGKCAKGVVQLRAEIIGDAQPDSILFQSALDSVMVTFMDGIHQVLLIARDSTGDIDTCIYVVELRDTIEPVIVCQTDTVYLHPSGNVPIDLSETDLLVSVTDNCNAADIMFHPDSVDCSSAGSEINVSIVALDDYGNSDTCEVLLFVTTQPLMPEWERGLCDDTLRLFANIPPGPDGNYIFNWSGPNGFNSAEENPILPGSDSTFSGTYLLTVMSENGCVSTGSVDIIIETLSAPQINIDQDTACVGEVFTITSQTYSGEVLYQWHQIDPFGDTTIHITTVPEFTSVIESEGDYWFYAIVSQDTCTSAASDTLGLTAVTAPVASIAPIDASLCSYDTLFLAPDTIIAGFIYSWTGPGGYFSNEPLPAGLSATEIDSPAIFYLTVSNPYCSSSPDSVEIFVQGPLATPSIEGDDLACEGGAFTLNTSTQADQYLWIDPMANTFLTEEDSLVVVPAQPEHTGDWHLITIVNGCLSDTSEAFTMQIDSAIAVDIIAPPVACEIDSIILMVSPSISAEYTWSGPGGFASTDIAPTVPAVEGMYTVFVETATGCEAKDTFQLQVDILPEVISIITDAPACADSITDIRLWAITDPVSEGSYQYFWNGPSGFASQDSSPLIQNFNSSLNGVYSLTIVNGTCTTDTSSIVIEVVDSPSSPLITGETMYCFGDTLELNIASPLPGAVYTWSFQDTVIVINSPGTLVITDADESISGTFQVDVFLNGCISNPSTVEIEVNPHLFAPVITSPSLVCEGDSLILFSDAPAGSIVHWSGPGGFTSMESTPVIFPALPVHGGFYLASYELNGCLSDTSSMTEIKVQSTLPVPQIISDITSICIDDPVPFSICLDKATLTPGGNYTWWLSGTILLAGPSGDSCITLNGDPLLGGTNQITVIAELQGCVSDTSSILTINGDEFPSQMADAGIDMQYCPDEEFSLDANDPAPGTGVWSSSSSLVVFVNENDPETNVNGLPTGEYQLTWTLSYASCPDYSSDSVQVNVIPSPEVLPDTVNVPFGQTVEFIATANDTLQGIAFTVMIISNPLKGNVLHAGNGVFRYTPNIGFVGTDMMIYRICSTDCPEECSEATVILRVGDEDDCFTPTLFTPNNDGVNDRLIIPCLETERYPDNKLIIFNEWGDAVFEASPYLNDWTGILSGEDLPVGTYFYIMDFGDGSEPKRTFLVLER